MGSTQITVKYSNVAVSNIYSLTYSFTHTHTHTHSHMSSFNLTHHNLTKVGSRTLLELAALFTSEMLIPSLKLLYIQIYTHMHTSIKNY